MRPEIITQPSESVVENFQNQTLRPILKQQNELLLAVFKQYISVRKGAFYKISETEQLEYISHSVKRDMKFKHYLEGIISGHFTLEEYRLFLENEEELTKRLINLLVQRLQSQLRLLTK